MTEDPKLIISASDRIMHRTISDADAINEGNVWALSNPIPGARILNTWEIYHGMMLVLATTEGGHYCIYRSIDRKNYVLVHEHNTRIYGLFYIDEGHAIFCASDGWWSTRNTGVVWNELSAVPDSMVPIAKTACILQVAESAWYIFAYGEDHKLYRREYPGDHEWSEVCDTTALWGDKWYPALAGSPVGILAGAGNKLLRSLAAGEIGSWVGIQEVEGTIKSIVASNQSNQPTFLIEVEQPDGETSKLYWSCDNGDSLIPDMSRMNAVSSVQSVYLTGTDEKQTMFAVLGKRAAGGQSSIKIIEEI